MLLRPFTGYVVASADARRIVAPPYDALTPQQRAALAASATESYLNVLPTGRGDGTSLEAELVRCREHLERLLATGHFDRLAEPTLAVYALTENGHRQVGVVGDVPVAAFADGEVLPHERVRGDRVANLVRYLEVVGVSSSPVCLAHPPSAELARLVSAATTAPPDVAFQDDDGTTQELWLVRDPDRQRAVTGALAATGRLLVVDGHHRAAAARAHAAAAGLPPDHPGTSVLCAVFPTDQLRILPFHRVVAVDLDPATLTARLGSWGVELEPLPGPWAPDAPGWFAVTTRGRWFRADLRDRRGDDDPVRSLDASLAARGLVAPLLDGGDPFDDPRVDPVAAPLGLRALERPAAVGIALPAATVEQVLAVVETGRTMPPKTTYFTPKARSGLLIRPRRVEA